MENFPTEASDKERAVAFARALTRRAVLAWKGIGDADGNAIDPTARVCSDLDMHIVEADSVLSTRARSDAIRCAGYEAKAPAAT